MAIVTTNLLLHLDAGDPSSYSGTGTTWTDLSPNAFTATLAASPNTPTYSTDNNGVFIFDGTDYASIPHSTTLKPTSAITVEAFAYLENWNISTAMDIISNTQSGGVSLSLNGGETSGNFSFLFRATEQYNEVTIPRSVLTSGWHHIVGTFDGRYAKLYVDSLLQNTVDIGTTTSLIHSSTNSLIIGGEAGTGSVPAGEYWNGRIANIKMYSAALTDAEVLQNFNEMNTRYSLTVPTDSTARVTRTAAHSLSLSSSEPDSPARVTRTAVHSLSLASSEPDSPARVTRTAVHFLMRDARAKSWAYILN
jgi:hypothetical protein